MKIEYYVIGPYGYGYIHQESIDTEGVNCICFDNKTVTIRESYLDLYDSEQFSNNTYFRTFEAVRTQLLETHKKVIADLQKNVNLLESAANYEGYRNNLFNKNP